MDSLQLQLVNALYRSAQRLRSANLPELAAQLEHLAEEVRQPCVVAIVGPVKAGKSTFVNALLGDDLAKVGATETTATINYFRYGIPDRDFPVSCYWRSGKVTSESRQFLDSLQGNDIETMRKADGIDHLEYRLQNPYLEQITLVDTPGTGSVEDTHQNRTAEFLNLYHQLRNRHSRETQHLGSEADAVIYLIGEITRVGDEAFLQEFQQATQGQSRSLNAIGVMARIDLNPEIIKRREELTRKISGQLARELNTVMPVSAGIQRALDHLLADDQTSLQHIITAFRRIPATVLDELLSDADLYLEADCPISYAERKQLRSEMPWKVFTTIVRQAADPSLDVPTVVRVLREIAGFERIHRILDRHFVRRGSFLRCYRIVHDALAIKEKLKFQYLSVDLERAIRRARFLGFIRQLQSKSPVAQELEAFIGEQLVARPELLKEIVEEIEREIGGIRNQLEAYNQDFEALTLIEDHAHLFTQDELKELRPLFGLYGLETEKRLPKARVARSYLERRQGYWQEREYTTQSSVLRKIAQQAVLRYDLLYKEIG